MKKRILVLAITALALAGCTGQVGPQGPKGDSGEPGLNGSDGQSLLTGHGAPTSSLGNDGDSYIDLDTWDYYSKSSGSWNKSGNIKGNDGTDGQNGTNGSDGAKGEKGDTGISVIGTKIDENGDLIVTFSDGTTHNAGHVKDVDEDKCIVNFHCGDEIVLTTTVDRFSMISKPTDEYLYDKGYIASNSWFYDENKMHYWGFDDYAYRVIGDLDLYVSEFIHADVIKGSYPQSLVIDGSLATSLSSAAGTLPTASDPASWTSYKYYANGSNDIDYMWYQDLYYENNTYRGVYFTNYRPDRCDRDFPSYEDGTYKAYSTNNVYWFKWEPIKWITLSSSDGSSFIYSAKNLDAQHYYHQYSREGNKRTRSPYNSSETAEVYDNNYKFSDIRGWLNTDFYNSAFSISERSSIKTTEVDNSAASTEDPANECCCENTNDKVFLLSYLEDEQYRSYADSMNSNAKRSTDYTRCISGDVGWSSNLLRSPDSATYRSDYGSVSCGYKTNAVVPIRPALNIQN